MRLKEARLLCPGFVQIPARPERYAAVSTAIMAALIDVTPDVEVFSVDGPFSMSPTANPCGARRPSSRN